VNTFNTPKSTSLLISPGYPEEVQLEITQAASLATSFVSV
jgi:hypothetical protein